MRFHELPAEPLVIRASGFTYVVLGLMFGVTLLLGLAAIPRNPSLWSAVVLNFISKSDVLWIMKVLCPQTER